MGRPKKNKTENAVLDSPTPVVVSLPQNVKDAVRTLSEHLGANVVAEHDVCGWVLKVEGHTSVSLPTKWKGMKVV